MTLKLIVLDRDGVINEDSDRYIKSADEWQPIPGSLQAIAALNKIGYVVVVATNQSGVARGLFDLATLDTIHKTMHRAVDEVGGKIDRVFFCPHGPEAGCSCRKPAPGLLHQIQQHYQIPFTDMLMVGDSMRDLQAAQAVNMPAALVKTGKGERSLRTHSLALGEVTVFENLAHVVLHLLRTQS